MTIDGNEVLLPKGAGPRTLVVATAGPTGQLVKRAADGAEGPVLDHYSREAVEHHLRTMGETLLRAAGGADFVHAVFCDSLEVYDADWTPALVEEFEARRGYDPRSSLFHLRLSGSAGATFRADYHRTLSELAEENFLDVVHRWASSHDVLFRVQNYGQPPVRVSGYRHADLIEGEGWGWLGIPQTKWASSAAHHLGVSVVSSETWTWVNSPSFRARPIDLKGEAHEHLLAGVNQFIGHGWPYSPASAPDPGWAFYASGAINDRNAWWIAAPELFRYLQRLCAVMRHGDHVADVAIWLPYDDAYASFRAEEELNLWKRSTDLIDAAVPVALRRAGYDYDLIDELVPTASVKARHRVVLLPDIERLTAEVEGRLHEFADAGIHLIQVGAQTEGRFERAVQVTTDDLISAVGQVVAPDMIVEDVSTETGANIAVGFVHRRLADSELYFIANTGPDPRSVTLFPRDGSPLWEEWDAHDGSRVLRTGAMRIELAPYGSSVIVTRAVDGEPLPSESPAMPTHLRVADLGPEVRLIGWDVSVKDSPTRRVHAPHKWDEDPQVPTSTTAAVYSTTVVLEADTDATLIMASHQLAVPHRTATQPQSFQAHAAVPLGAVAEVRVNGVSAGIVWDHPYVLPVQGLLREGENSIEIHVRGVSLPAMRSVEWSEIFRRARERFGARFDMQDLAEVDRPTDNGLLVVPTLLLAAPGARGAAAG
ncbi:glycosyl hydrolase [Microbacterium sp. GXF0217]